MDKPYVYKPYLLVSWMLIDAEMWQREDNALYWNRTTEHPTTKCGVAPQFILAAYDEKNKVLTVFDK